MMQRLIWAVVALLAGSVGPGRADDGFAYTIGSQGGGDGQLSFPAAVAQTNARKPLEGATAKPALPEADLGYLDPRLFGREPEE
jgi:hypothetical protein